MATYDIKTVDDFLILAKETYDDRCMAVLGVHLAFGIGMWPLMKIHFAKDDNPEGRLINVWFKMSAWERSSVLFSLAPLVERALAGAAKALAGEARIQDPI